MTTLQLKNEISSKVGFTVRVKDNGSFFSVGLSKLDGTQSFHNHKEWFNETFVSTDKMIPVCVDACSAFISKKSFNA